MRWQKFGALLLSLTVLAAGVGGCAMPTTGGGEKTQEAAKGGQTGESGQAGENSQSGENGQAGESGQSGENGQAEKSEGSKEKITLRVVDWSDSSMARREEFNKKYMEKHQNITIEYTMLTMDQFKNTIVTMIKSGDGPDLFPIPSGMTLSTALKEDWYQPINGYVTDGFMASLDPSVLKEGVSMEGKDLYSIPENMPVVNCLLFYNKDVLQNAGVAQVPKTYSEFAEACKKITESGKGQVYGLIDGGKQLNRLSVLACSLAAAGGGRIAADSKVLTDNGRAPYDSAAMNGAMALMERLVKDGSVHPDTVNLNAPEARELFAQGQAGFLCQGMWCIAPWAKDYPNLNYGVMAVPVPDGGAKGGVQQVDLSPWMGIYKQSRHPKEAADYLMALFSEEYGYQSGCVSDGSYVSIVPQVNQKYMTNPAMKEYYDIARETSRIVPSATVRDPKAYDFYAEVRDVQPSLGAILQGVLSGSVTDYSAQLKKLSDASTTEWERAAKAVGLDFGTFEFPNWDPMKDYTQADYQALK